MDTVSRSTLDPWYVTGFVESAGAFTFSRSGTRDQNLSLYFGIKLREEYGETLEEIADFFGVGRVYAVGASRYFRVSHLAHHAVVIRHFERYPLRGPKREGFDAWKEMVELKQTNFRKIPRERLDELADRLSALSPRAGRTQKPTR